MADVLPTDLSSVVAERLVASRDQIARSLRQIAHGNPLGAETEIQRANDRLRAKLAGAAPDARVGAPAEIVKSIRETAAAIDRPSAAESSQIPEVGPESIIGNTYDFVGVSFLSRGRRAADAVARIIHRDDGRPRGSGFLVAPGVLLTNQHVVGSAGEARDYLAQFNYETDDAGQDVPTSTFELDGQFFIVDPYTRLDYALIMIGARVSGPQTIDSLGHIPLSSASDKHMLGEVANIVQHPSGRRKEVVLRENRLVARLDKVLHYIADTQGGSSGSPVFNNEWQVIALHHWGGRGPLAVSDLMTTNEAAVNEGVRISAIFADLEAKRSGGVAGADRLGALLEFWSSRSGQPARGTAVKNGQSESADKHTNGRRRMPRRDRDLSDRTGYEPGFIRGFSVPLPELKNVKHAPARNREARIGDNPFELPYRHFSIVMNADRRLAFFTACNIDGRHSRHVVRKNKTIDDNATLADRDLERMEALEAMEAAEGADPFRIDPRVHEDHQMGVEFYERQNVPGFPDPNTGARRARMFQKGHITLRTDPAWGSDEETLQGEDDTFYYTNAAPQFGYFNQGSPINEPGQKGKLRWRAVETYVLRNAVTMRERVSVFAGPVFRDHDDTAIVPGDRPENKFMADPVYRGVQVPMQFWKIVVWAEDHELRSVALLAEQWSVFRVTNGMPERLDEPERYDDPAELQRVKAFLSRISVIEKLTGLKFSDEVRDADIMANRNLDDIEDTEAGLRELLAGRTSPPQPAAAKKPATRRPAMATERRASGAAKRSPGKPPKKKAKKKK